MNNAELNCKWHFAEKIGGGDQGPNDPMEQNFKKNQWSSIVREAIQNSLDAVDDPARPVKVEIEFKSMKTNNYPNLLKLKSEIDECLEYFSDNDNAKLIYPPMIDYLKIIDTDFNRNLHYIKIADYNTKGMDYVKGGTDSPFYAFVRAAGVSSKNDKSSGGSYGFGKAAYFYLSAIRTLIISTKTKYGKYFFEGVASLCTHGKDCRKEAIGYYDNNGGEPVDRPEDIPQRFKRDEAGTDINIIGVQGLADNDSKEQICADMTRAVLRNFWLAIYDKKLEVTIHGENITSDNIVGKMQEYFEEEHDFTKKKTITNYNPRPYLEAVRLADKDDKHVHVEKELPLLGKVHFYAYKHKDANDKILYMRSPKMLVYGENNRTSYGFYGVFVCDDKEGNEILRRMENPAHTAWDADQDKYNKNENKEAKNELSNFIKQCVEIIFPTNLSAITAISGLENYLYIHTAEDNDESSITDKSDKTSLDETSTINSEKTIVPNMRQPEGLVVTNIRAMASKHADGNLLSGHSSRRSKTKGGNIGTGNLRQKNISDEKQGMEGTYAEPVSIKYRSYAKDLNREMYHFIIIRSDTDIKNARLDITVCGTQDDELVKIKSSTRGTVHGNSISDLSIPSKGKFVICIQFVDNMKHAIKLEPYEIK